MGSFIAKPKSRKKLQDVAIVLRKILKIGEYEAFPMMEMIEFMLDGFGYVMHVCDKSELKDKYAETRISEKLLVIREDVYEQAAEGNPRHLFTLAHELGHIILHNPNTISFARQKMCRIFEDPEWQANVFAAELLAPSIYIQGKTALEVSKLYKCSLKVAKIQLSYASNN